MPAPEHAQHIKMRSMQLEIPTHPQASAPDDFDDKIKAAEEEMERIKTQREQLARKKQEIEDLTARKRLFLSQQSTLCEKLTSAMTLINREMETMRKEVEDLEECRKCFAVHLEKIDKINPESWSTDNLADRLERANVLVDVASDDYEQAAAHFQHGRCAAVFCRTGAAGRMLSAVGGGEFMRNFRNGLAFNLPLCALAVAGLVIYLCR